MDTKRQNKISRLIQKDLGEIFQLESHKLFPGVLITLTQVKVSTDLSLAKIYVSIFGKGSHEDVLKKIQGGAKDLRYQLARRVKNQLRAVPELQFYLDDSLDYIDNIDNLLKKG